jgi:hypothetical protein
MAIFKTFSRLYQRNHRIPNLIFKALEFFFRIPKLFQIFPDRGNPVNILYNILADTSFKKDTCTFHTDRLFLH